MKIRNIVASVLLLGIARTAAAGTWYVATNGNDSSNGSTWTTAKRTIQAAIDVAVSNDTVLVSNGVYATGGRVPHGILTNRVVIDKPITVRSVNGPSNTFIKGAGPMGDSAVRCAYVGTNAVLSGFTLTNGATRTNGVKFFDQMGGGAWCDYEGVLTNCTLTGNAANDSGGGAFAGTLNNCLLSGNTASNWGGGASFSTLNNCILSGNSAYSGGGAAYSTLNNSILSGNSASNSGGGVNFSTLNNCILSGNSAADGGGGAFDSTLVNCTLSENSSGSGGGADSSTLNNCILSGNTATNFSGGANGSTLTNCIVYFNSSPHNPNYFDSTFAFSCTTPDPGGTGNITNDPQFVDAAAGNYRLRADSPCIDRGTNLDLLGPTDRDGNPRIVNGCVDMGAFEYQGAEPAPSNYWVWAAAIKNGLTNYADCATGDGYPNLLKYATGSSATVPDGLARIEPGLANGLFQVHFNRNANAADITLIVESASSVTNGAKWRGIATNILGSWGGASNVAESGSGSPLAVTVSEPGPSSNGYMRLRVTRP